MTGQTGLGVDMALVRELARVGNLLRQLTDAVQRGALCGEPADAHEVLRVLENLECKLGQLTRAEVE